MSKYAVSTVFKSIDKMTAPVKKMQSAVGKFTTSAENGMRKLDDRMDSLRGKMKAAGTAILATSALMTAPLVDAAIVGAEFEQSLVNAAAKFPGEITKTSDAFKRLEKAARETGASTIFSASESAQALDFLAMAGFNADQAISALPGVVDLATAANIDLAKATDVASDALSMFGMMSDDSAQLGKNLQKVNDVIAKTSTSANTSVEMLFETFKESGAVATSAGQSLETVAALAGTLANSGIKGGQAGTVLKNALIRLQAPAGEASKILNRMGIAVQNQDGSMRDMITIIGDLNKATKKMGDVERNALMSKVFGMEAISGMNVLMGAGEDQLKAYRKQIELSDGAAGKMAKMMGDTVQGSYKGLMSAVEGVKISLFSLNSGALKETIDKTTEWVRANNDLISTKVTDFIGGIVGFLQKYGEYIPTVLKLVGAFLAVNMALKGFIVVMTAANLVMAANPLVLIAAAIASVAAGFAYLVYNVDEVIASFSSMNPVMRAILAPLNLILTAIKFIKDALQGGFGSAVTKLAERFGFTNDDAEVNVNKNISTESVIGPQERQAAYYGRMQGSVDVNVYGHNGVRPERDTYTSRLSLANSGN